MRYFQLLHEHLLASPFANSENMAAWVEDFESSAISSADSSSGLTCVYKGVYYLPASRADINIAALVQVWLCKHDPSRASKSNSTFTIQSDPISGGTADLQIEVGFNETYKFTLDEAGEWQLDDGERYTLRSEADYELLTGNEFEDIRQAQFLPGIDIPGDETTEASDEPAN